MTLQSTIQLPVTTTAIVTAPSVRARCLVCNKFFVAARRSAKTCSDTCRQAMSRARWQATPPLPSGPFDLIVADPPWHFRTYSEKGQGRSASRHYQTMGVDWLFNLPIGDLAAPDAGLALWAYGPMLPQALELFVRWGFEYKSDLFTWMKTTASGTPAFGMGYLTRKCTEQVLYGTRGRGLKRVNCGVSQAILAPRREHSRKPDEIFEALGRLFGPVRRIELFARRPRTGWEVWGNEIRPPET